MCVWGDIITGVALLLGWTYYFPRMMHNQIHVLLILLLGWCRNWFQVGSNTGLLLFLHFITGKGGLLLLGYWPIAALVSLNWTTPQDFTNLCLDCYGVCVWIS